MWKMGLLLSQPDEMIAGRAPRDPWKGFLHPSRPSVPPASRLRAASLNPVLGGWYLQRTICLSSTLVLPGRFQDALFTPHCSRQLFACLPGLHYLICHPVKGGKRERWP